MLTSKEIPIKMIPRAIPNVKFPRFVCCMIAVVITFVFQAMAPPTIETAPTSAMERENANRYAEIMGYTHSLHKSRKVFVRPNPSPFAVCRMAGDTVET